MHMGEASGTPLGLELECHMPCKQEQDENNRAHSLCDLFLGRLFAQERSGHNALIALLFKDSLHVDCIGGVLTLL